MKTKIIAAAFLVCLSSAFSQIWNVELIGSCYDLWSQPTSVAVSGNYAYVTTSSTGLRIVDISDRTNPFEVGHCTIPGNAYSVTASGNYAYVMCKQGNVIVYNVSNPANSSIAAQLVLPGVAFKGVISGDYLYVADSSSGLQIIDVSDPYYPTIISSIPTSSYIQDIDIEGNFAYLAASLAGLRVIDISDPSHPSEIAADSSGFYASKIAVEGDYAYIIKDLYQLSIYDISEPSNPIEIDSSLFFEYPRALGVSGSNVYIAVTYPSSSEINGGAGLILIDVSDPHNPYGTPIYHTSDLVMDITIDENFAYLVNSWEGLRILDISSPSQPQEIGCYNTPSYCTSVVTAGNHAFTSHGSDGLRVIDITNSSNPFETTYLQLDIPLSDIVWHEQTIFASTSISWDSCGFVTIDVSNPNQPVEISRFLFLQMPNSIRLSIINDYAYVIMDSIYIFCIADINNIHQISTFARENPVYEVVVSGGYLYTTYLSYSNHIGTLTIYNVSNPYHLYQVGNWSTPAFHFHGLSVSYNHAFLTTENEGIANFIILDVSNPASPQEIGSCQIPHYAHEIFVSGNIAVLADGESGLRIIDISDPANPNEIGYYDTPGVAYDVSVSDALAMVADNYFFGIYDFSEAIGNARVPKMPQSFSLFPAYPNPFNATTMLRYSIPQTGHVTLTIYNILGESVRTIVDRSMMPGIYSAIWDAGNSASGIYFCRMKSGSFQQTRKLVLIK